LTKWYDPRQIRDMLLKRGYNEIITYDKEIRYFIKGQHFIKLKISSRRGHEKIIRDQVELICEYNRIPLEDFDLWYKRAKKHKKL
jgi:hypothetical protein